MELPSYDDLPLTAGYRTSWGLFGVDDVLGCLNLLTTERALRGAGCVTRGAVFPLDAPLDAIDPPIFDRAPLAHEIYQWPGGNSYDDHITSFNTQSSSQWDGFAHMGDPSLGFYNGRPADALRIDDWARKGIVGRGVLADVARWRTAQGRPIDLAGRGVIESADIVATLNAQGVAAEPGDVLLVRTGWLGRYLTLDGAGRGRVSALGGLPGLSAAPDMARTLWNLHIAAVAADNPGLEAFPHDAPAAGPEGARDGGAEGGAGNLHWDLLPRLGIPVGELWSLDDLAADCAADGVYEFLLTSAPLNLPRGVASTPNALAVK